MSSVVTDRAIRNVMSLHLFLWGVNAMAFILATFRALRRANINSQEADLAASASLDSDEKHNVTVYLEPFGWFSSYSSFLVVLLFALYSINSISILFLTDYFVGPSFYLNCKGTFIAIGITLMLGRLAEGLFYIDRLAYIFRDLESEELKIEQQTVKYFRICLAVYFVGFFALGMVSGATEIIASRSSTGLYRVCTSSEAYPTVGIIAAIYNDFFTLGMHYFLGKEFVTRLWKLEANQVSTLSKFSVRMRVFLVLATIIASATAIFVRNDLMNIVPANYYFFLVSCFANVSQVLTYRNEWLVMQKFKAE